MLISLNQLCEDDIASEDRRSEERHDTIYRPCCILCDGKVHLGLIRNQSPGGAQVEVDADLKAGDEVIYFWDYKNSVDARVVWAEDGRIGLIHTADVDPFKHKFPPRSVRVPLKGEATVWFNGVKDTVEVENISLGGMSVVDEGVLDVGTRLTIQFCGIEICDASVRWQGGGRAGIRFAERLNRKSLAKILQHKSLRFDSIDFLQRH